MSLPSSKILKASKSIMAIADLKHNSPNTQQAQNVNIIMNTPYDSIPTVAYPKVETKPETKEKTEQEQTPENPYANVATRDIKTAYEKTAEISDEIEEKENTIKALSLIINIIQSNPLIVNKFVIADTETLQELIKLMTNAESVEIDTDDIECSCFNPKYRIIKRIYIRKSGEVYGINQCPILLRLFDNYKISLNFVI